MDAEAVRQLRMGIGWVFLIRGDAVWIVLAYWLDRIVSAGSYQETLALMRWLVTGWMGQMGWTEKMGR